MTEILTRQKEQLTWLIIHNKRFIKFRVLKADVRADTSLQVADLLWVRRCLSTHWDTNPCLSCHLGRTIWLSKCLRVE